MRGGQASPGCPIVNFQQPVTLSQDGVIQTLEPGATGMVREGRFLIHNPDAQHAFVCKEGLAFGTVPIGNGAIGVMQLYVR